MKTSSESSLSSGSEGRGKTSTSTTSSCMSRPRSKKSMILEITSDFLPETCIPLFLQNSRNSSICIKFRSSVGGIKAFTILPIRSSLVPLNWRKVLFKTMCNCSFLTKLSKRV